MNWSWGQLPQVSNEYDRLQQVVEESQDSIAFETPAQTPVRETSAGDDDKDDAITLGTLDASFLLDQVVPSLPNETTPTNAELKKTPPGLTLEELELAEPQVQALYLTQPVRNESQSQAIGKGEIMPDIHPTLLVTFFMGLSNFALYTDFLLL